MRIGVSLLVHCWHRSCDIQSGFQFLDDIRLDSVRVSGRSETTFVVFVLGSGEGANLVLSECGVQCAV